LGEVPGEGIPWMHDHRLIFNRSVANDSEPLLGRRVDRVTEADVLPLDRYITASGREADIRLLAADIMLDHPNFRDRRWPNVKVVYRVGSLCARMIELCGFRFSIQSLTYSNDAELEFQSRQAYPAAK